MFASSIVVCHYVGVAAAISRASAANFCPSIDGPYDMHGEINPPKDVYSIRDRKGFRQAVTDMIGIDTICSTNMAF